jgi:predicted DNA-binding protein
MSINLPLEPHEEALLAALARSKGLSSDDLVREAIEKMLADAPADVFRKEPTRSLRGLLSKYGPAASTEEIDENRADMSANFPRADF